MLYTIDKKQITVIPHLANYKRWRAKLTEKQYTEIMEALEKILDGDEVVVSSFIPGSNWQYPYYHIYTACDNDYQNSAFFFGLLVWEAVMKHGATWSFIHKPKEDPIRGKRYFRITL